MKKEAWECFTRCIDVTPEMAREVIKVIRVIQRKVAIFLLSQINILEQEVKKWAQLRGKLTKQHIFIATGSTGK